MQKWIREVVFFLAAIVLGLFMSACGGGGGGNGNGSTIGSGGGSGTLSGNAK